MWGEKTDSVGSSAPTLQLAVCDVMCFAPDPHQVSQCAEI